MLGGKVQHTGNCLGLGLIKRYHAFECNSSITIALVSLHSQRTETLTRFDSLNSVKDVMIVLSGVDEIAVYGVELKG
jgi:hypothetical protein